MCVLTQLYVGRHVDGFHVSWGFSASYSSSSEGTLVVLHSALSLEGHPSPTLKHCSPCPEICCFTSLRQTWALCCYDFLLSNSLGEFLGLFPSQCWWYRQFVPESVVFPASISPEGSAVGELLSVTHAFVCKGPSTFIKPQDNEQ